MRILFLWIGMLCWSGIVSAQVSYVRTDGNDNADGRNWDNAKATIAKALESGAREIRVMTGTYDITAELQIPAGVEVHGGYTGVGEEQVTDRAKQTILKGNQTCRIARVGGILDGFTVTLGQALQANGGGVYVTGGGKVESCIVMECQAVTSVSVGMYLCRDGSFLSPDDLQEDSYQKVRGCVFYVNPDLNAPEGKRGWIFSNQKPLRGEWKGCTTGDYYPDLGSVIEDMDGIAHTKKLAAQGKGNFAVLAQTYESYPGGDAGTWFCASVGQALLIKNNFRTIYESIEKFQAKVAKNKWRDVFGYPEGHWLNQAEALSTSSEVSSSEHWFVHVVNGERIIKMDKSDKNDFLMISPF